MPIRYIPLALVALLMSLSAQAQIELSLNAGVAEAASSRYRNSDTPYFNVSAGYRWRPWGVRAGYLGMSDFRALTPQGYTVRIRPRGYYLAGAYQYDFGFLDGELAVGLARLKTSARVDRRTVAERTDWEPFIELGASRTLLKWLAVRGSVIYFNDHLGSDIYAATVGVRFSL